MTDNNKKTIIVIYNENADNPENSWSGTSYSLRKALEQFSNVIFIDSTKKWHEELISKVSYKLGKYISTGVLGYIEDKLYSQRISRLVSRYENAPVLQIANDIILKQDYYLYHDLSYYCWVDANKKIAGTGRAFVKGNLNAYCDKELNRKIKREEILINKSKKVFYMGEWVSKEMKSHYPHLEEKFLAIGGGINKKFSKQDTNKVHNQILFAGIDFERKGGDLLLEAFTILKNSYLSDAKLVIAGVEEKRKTDGVTWEGRVDRKRLSELYSESEVFCMPSVFEPYGLVFLEALSFGLPVVARDCYEMKYIVEQGENGYLIKEEDSAELALCLYNALVNNELKTKVKESAELYREKYSWTSVAEKIISQIK